MDPTQAIRLINDLISVEVEIVKRANRGSGRISKALQESEHRAITKLYVALVDLKPTPEQLTEMETV